MNFIEVQDLSYWWIAPAVTTILLIWIWIEAADKNTKTAYNSRADKNSILIMWITGVSAILFMCISCSTPAFEDSMIRSDALESRVHEIDEVYGFKISEEDFLKLEYPDKRPTADSEVFGNFERGLLAEEDTLAKSNVTLAWIENELRLFESTDDGKLGLELPRLESKK